jgi:CubicO group peptidase (beta-lactamase class C family)
MGSDGRGAYSGRGSATIAAVPISRRTVIGGGLAFTGAAITGSALNGCTRDLGVARRTGETARDVAGSPSSQPAAASPVSPATAEYAPHLVAALRRYLAPAPDHPVHPAYSGAVVLTSVDGVVTAHEAVGDALRCGAGPVELPVARRVPMRPDSIFDLASVTKVFTAILAMQQAERGRIGLDVPVAEYLDEFGNGDKRAVTVAMLLTHTSGLPAGISLGHLSSNATRYAAIRAARLVAGAVPGREFRYGSHNLQVLEEVLKKVTGQPFAELMRADLIDPLGLRDTRFGPVRGALADRVVATDARARLIRGTVHDDTARLLGGVAGHAGLFSTAADLAVIGHVILGGGEYRGIRVLTEASVRRMWTDANAGIPAVPDDTHQGWSAAHGLGLKLAQPWLMGRLSSITTCGHSGFTGTSLVVDHRRRAVVVLLTNTAHPDWRRSKADPARIAIADIVADAVPPR